MFRVPEPRGQVVFHWVSIPYWITVVYTGVPWSRVEKIRNLSRGRRVWLIDGWNQFAVSVMEEAPPPTNHILRPHHIDLLAIFLLLFKEYEPKLPAPFTLHVYRVLLDEVAEARLLKLDMSSEYSVITRFQNPDHIWTCRESLPLARNPRTLKLAKCLLSWEEWSEMLS